MSQTVCPPAVYDTIKASYASDEVNMFDAEIVQTLAANRDDPRTVTWIEENQDAYFELVSSWP